jgi:5-methylthioadenosine/S-adenosylhomocysteine deaminase
MIIETDGVVTPGLIDLHGHPEFNVFAAWEPPKQYVNRYAWRGGAEYQTLVRDPANELGDAGLRKEQLRYAEVRALVGGVTAIQGAGESADSSEALVRNVDRVIFGKHIARTAIDLPGEPTATDPDGFGMDTWENILEDIESGTTTRLYVHLAEGQSSNDRSREELDKLVRLKGLTAATVVIHGTALSEDQLGDLKDAGAKLVWSPQSNLRLYAETTLADRALALDLPLALGADWLPSGSSSLLAEMKVARNWLADHGVDLGATALVQMVTETAAEIAGLEDDLGRLKADRPADVAVFERRFDDPWECVAHATPAEVSLVMIGGDVAYIREDWLAGLGAEEHEEHLERLLAWGKRMVLDTSYVVETGDAQPRLNTIRAGLIAAYPNIGPIFA